MLVGNKGQQYGLIKKTSLFSADDDTSDVNAQIQAEEVHRSQLNKVRVLIVPLTP